MKIAIIHDDLTQRGGAERVVEAMHAIWPDAPIYTSVHDPETTFSSLNEGTIRTSFMQKIPFAANFKFNKLFLMLYPIAFETFDLREFDVVLSSSTRFSHGVVTGSNVCHISYCHSPSRFAWRYHEYISESNLNNLYRIILPYIVNKLRIWDFSASARVDYFIANSMNTSRRIRKFYRRNAYVVFPPIDTERFYIAEKPRCDYYLIVSRLLPYKKIDIVIEACNQMNLPLKIVGVGPDMTRLKKLAGSSVELLGRVPDGMVEELFANCRAFLFPGEEDFGIAPVEAMAAGRPVIAYRAGGSLETIIEGKTGIFFNEQSVDSVIGAFNEFEKYKFIPEELREHALKFNFENFKEKLTLTIENCLKLHSENLDLN